MVRWTAVAKRDLKKIYDYIAADSKFYAKRVVDNIVDKTEILNISPEIGRKVPELEESNVLELIIYSYRLVYQVKFNDVHILTIIHGKRDFLKAYEQQK